MKSDKTRFMEIEEKIKLHFARCFEIEIATQPPIYEFTLLNKFLKEIRELFLKHYEISEDEILILAKGIKLKREASL